MDIRIEDHNRVTAMKTILLVEDDLVVLAAYQERLQHAGFHVETALDGLAAMKLLHSAKPDVVVLDMMIPKFSGLEVLKYIRSEAWLKDVGVIVLSNMLFGSEQREVAAFEADRTTTKSECTPVRLIAAISEVLATKASKTCTTPIEDVERRLPS